MAKTWKPPGGAVHGPLPAAMDLGERRLLDELGRDNVPRALREETGGYWPAYLFGRDPIVMPISGAGLGFGARNHANNEYYVIEGSGDVYGLAGAEKIVAAILYNFAGLN